MFERLKLSQFCKAISLLTPIFALSMLAGAPKASTADKPEPKIDAFQVLVVNEDGSNKGMEKAYTFAGVIIDRARRVKRNETDAEVKVAEKLPTGKSSGKSYDVVFLIRAGAISDGKILTLTSASPDSCRPFMKTFLTKTLSSKSTDKAYKGAKLATVNEDSSAKSLAEGLEKNGWLGNC